MTATAGTSEVAPIREGLFCRTTPLSVRLVAPDRPGYGHTRIGRAGAAGDLTPTSVLAEWTVKAAVSVRPGYLVVLGGPTSSRPVRVTLRAEDGVPFRVTGVMSTFPSVKAVGAGRTGGDAETWDIDVEAVPGSSVETAAGEVVIETTHPRAPTVRVPVAVVASASTPTGHGVPRADKP